MDFSLPVTFFSKDGETQKAPREAGPGVAGSLAPRCLILSQGSWSPGEKAEQRLRGRTFVPCASAPKSGKAGGRSRGIVGAPPPHTHTHKPLHHGPLCGTQQESGWAFRGQWRWAAGTGAFHLGGGS